MSKLLKRKAAPIDRPDEKVPCPKCGKEFKDQTGVDIHLGNGKEGRAASCPILKKLKMNKEELESFEKREAEKVPCPMCLKRLSCEESVRRHLGLLKNQTTACPFMKPIDPTHEYSCQHCTTGFTNKDKRDTHVRFICSVVKALAFEDEDIEDDGSGTEDMEEE